MLDHTRADEQRAAQRHGARRWRLTAAGLAEAGRHDICLTSLLRALVEPHVIGASEASHWWVRSGTPGGGSVAVRTERRDDGVHELVGVERIRSLSDLASGLRWQLAAGATALILAAPLASHAAAADGLAGGAQTAYAGPLAFALVLAGLAGALVAGVLGRRALRGARDLGRETVSRFRDAERAARDRFRDTVVALDQTPREAYATYGVACRRAGLPPEALPSAHEEALLAAAAERCRRVVLVSCLSAVLIVLLTAALAVVVA